MKVKPTASTESDTPVFRPGLLAELWAHLDRLNVSQELRAYVREALKDPSRRVRSTPKSMSGRYQSRKMGVSIGFESATLELPAIVEMEHDDDVLFIFDQPPPLKLTYLHHGRRRGHLYTPDFLVIRRTGIEFVECKRQEVVDLRASKDPAYYTLLDGLWICPPAQAAAGELGVRHELWTERHFNPIALSNMMFLGRYLDGARDIPGYDAALAQVKTTLNCLAKVSIGSILEKSTGSVTVDHIYLAIGRGDVVIDWNAAPIRNGEHCFLYRDEETLLSYRACDPDAHARQGLIGADTAPAPVVIAAGQIVTWDEQLWRIVSVGSSQAMIECNGRSAEFPLDVLHDLARRGKLTPAGGDTSSTKTQNYVDAVIRRSRRKDLEEANRRMDVIRPYLTSRRASPEGRTARRYLSQYKDAQRLHGNGYVGLIPRVSASGSRTPKIVKSVVELAMDVVKKRLLNPDNVRVKTAWSFLDDLCKEKALPTPSYKWFVRFVKRLPAYELANARGGAKKAYDLEARVQGTDLALAMEPDRIWQRAHIDHTLVDLETMFPGSTDNAGRVWATLMLDHHSRRVLAVFLSYEPPSYRSVMGVLRDCVRRWGRLPESLMLDGGKEFQGLWLQALCSRYHVNLQYRPPCKPRFGAQVERFIGTLNTNLIHFLKGNTQLRKNVRQMTKAVDPDRFAIWTFSELCDLVEEYLFEVYDILKHRELLASPRATFERSIALAGHREIHVVPYNRDFVLATCPSPRKGTARVQVDGVKINYLYYSAPGFQAYLGRDVEVRYDPGNLGVAYAFVGGEWIRLTCTRHAKLVWGLTERQLQAFTTEWRKQRSDVERERLKDSTLIQFLKKVYDQQTVLVARRQAAEERQRLLAAGALPEDWDEEDLQDDAGGSGMPAPDEADDPPQLDKRPAKPVGKDIVISPMEAF